MSRFDDYFRWVWRDLREKFGRIRAVSTDRTVRGGQNEAAIKAFIEDHSLASSVRQNVQVIDSQGRISDELDLVAWSIACAKTETNRKKLGWWSMGRRVTPGLITTTSLTCIVRRAKRVA